MAPLTRRDRLWVAAARLAQGLAAGVILASAVFWGRVAPAQLAAAQARLGSLRPAAVDPTPVPSLLRQRLLQAQQQLQQVQARVPTTLTSLQMATALDATAAATGVAIQSVTFGPPHPAAVAGYTAWPVTVGLLAPSPQATAAFLQRLATGALPAVATVTSLALTPQPQTLSVTVTFFTREGS